RFRIADGAGDFYLVVSALVPYKRIDLAIGAARRLDRRLVIVGTGPEERRLKALAGPRVEFLGWRDDREVADLYARCRAVLFPAVEDFGIVPLEAAAAGRPAIALGPGGVPETLGGLAAAAPARTAVFFAKRPAGALTARWAPSRPPRTGSTPRRCGRAPRSSTGRSSSVGSSSTSTRAGG